MRLQVVDLFDLTVEACGDDVPNLCCGVRPHFFVTCSSSHPTSRDGSTFVFNQVV
jgi:hypothetical protein